MRTIAISDSSAASSQPPSSFTSSPIPGHTTRRVVAELLGPTGCRVVAEAGYSMLHNANGELAMVVAREWRGWLGPYLLDVVAEIAAARGVPNLEAEVLAADRQMLALLRSADASSSTTTVGTSFV